MSINAIKDDEHISTASKKTTLLRLFRYLLAYRGTIALVIIIMLITVAISIINPLLIERAIDVHIANRDVKRLLLLVGFAVAINLLFILLVKIRMYLMAKMSNDVLVRIRQELYTHIQKLSFNFFDSRPTGKILARIIGDVNSLKDVLSDSVTTLIPDCNHKCCSCYNADKKLETGSCLFDKPSFDDGRLVVYRNQISSKMAYTQEKELQPECLYP